MPPDGPSPLHVLPDGPHRLITLGAVKLLRANGDACFDQPAPLAVLAYLIAVGGSAPRDHLADLFWSQSDHPRHNLRQALTRLRKALGREAFAESDGEAALRLEVRSDHGEFLRAIETRDLAAAVRLYAGDFFPGFSSPGSVRFEQWADTERAHLRSRFIHAAETLARQAMDRGDIQSAIGLAKRMQKEEPEHEPADRLILEALISRDPFAAKVEADTIDSRYHAEGRAPELATARLLSLARQDTPRSTPSGGARALVADLVGRERELHALLDTWREATEGRVGHIHLSAPSGLGKTRLLETLEARLRTRGVQVLRISATPMDERIDGAFVRELVGLLGRRPGAKAVGDVISRILVHLNPSLGAEYPQAVVAHRGRDTLADQVIAIRELLREVVEEGPLALLVDDTHWLDQESRTILQSVLERFTAARLLVATAGRPGAPPPTTLHSRRLALEPLSAADIESLLASLAAFTDQTLGARLAEALHGTTGGSPLLVLESIKLALERDELVRVDGSWRIDDVGALERSFARPTAIEERLGSLSMEERRCLLFAAAAATPVSPDVVSTGVGEASLATTHSLEHRGYLSLAARGWVVSHDRLAEVILASAGEDERRQARLAVGRALASSRDRDEARMCFALSLFVSAGALAEFRPWFAGWVRERRAQGDGRSAAGMAAALLGPSASPRDIRLLLSDISPYRRLSARGRAGVVAAAGVAAILAASAAIATRAGPPPDATIIGWIHNTEHAVTLFEAPLRHEGWRGGVRVDLRKSRRPPVRMLTNRSAGFPILSPDGTRLVFEDVVADSGIMDLFMSGSDGIVSRLTFSPGDDVLPTWSPDGRFIAFSTGRWTPPEDRDMDVAILDPTTGVVRQLTRGGDTDRWPAWSPDGTRLAFHRTGRDGATHLCWVTPDEQVVECPIQLPGSWGAVVGWRGPSSVLLLDRTRGQSEKLLIADLPTSELRLVADGMGETVRASSDGEWIVTSSILPDGRRSWSVFPTDEPAKARPLGNEGAEYLGSIISHRRPGRMALAGLRVGGRIIPRAVPLRFAPDGRDHDGAEVRLSPDVLRWSSSDTAVVRIDSRTGVMLGSRRGRAWVRVSAGGWLADSAVVDVVEGGDSATLVEQWHDTTLSGWSHFGTPRSLVVRDVRGQLAFLNNGDESFDSGILSPPLSQGLAGFGIEVEVATPIVRPKWQSLRAMIVPRAVLLPNGFADGAPGGCSYQVPETEGPDLQQTVSVSTRGEDSRSEIRPDLTDGRWYRVRLQTFPDGSCGIAINGRAYWRSRTSHPVAGPFFVALYGHSVGTRVLVGRLEAWDGVRTDVDWGSLDWKPR